MQFSQPPIRDPIIKRRDRTTGDDNGARCSTLRSNDFDGEWSVPWVTWLSQLWLIVSSSVESGPTINRPVKNLWVGRRYWDSSLGYPIYWDGATWVDSSGLPV